MIVKCEHCGKDIDVGDYLDEIGETEPDEDELFFHPECFDKLIEIGEIELDEDGD